ncbi:hypothetical protein SUGI_0419070 [Cryptomeria japonica]|nr:hypothetical protein SUGI_0419070 [Cryptomeria japonica]
MMHRVGRGVWRIKMGIRGKAGLRSRIQISGPRLRLVSVLEKMKKVNNCFLHWIASAGKNRLGAFVGAKSAVSVTAPSAATRPYYGRSNSFYAAAIADCIEFIKLSSSQGAISHS